MKSKELIPKGMGFLPGTSKSYLLKCHKIETDPKIRDKLMAYALRKDGMSIRNIGKTLNRPYTTINDWLLRAVQLGILGRYEVMQEGRPCRLNPKQLAQLYADIKAGPNECGFESKVWTCRIIVIHVKKKFGVQYTERGMYNLLDRLNFSCKKPRQKHPKSASRQAINKFKRESNALVKKCSNKGYKIFAEDESYNILGCTVKSSWYPKGKQVETTVSLSQKRICSFGALSEFGFEHKFYDKANSETFCDYLAHLHKKHGKFVMFLDNASYHKSAATKKFLAEYGKDIVLIFLPPYTPELNPVEIQWRGVKRGAANRLYKEVDEMKKSIKYMLRKGEIKTVKMFDYLTQ